MAPAQSPCDAERRCCQPVDQVVGDARSWLQHHRRHEEPAFRHLHQCTTEVAGLGGDAQFVKFTARGTYYQTLSEEMDIVGMLAGGAGHMQGFGAGGSAYSICSRATTASSAASSMAALDRTMPRHLIICGGTTYFNASAEAQFPMPVLPESFGLRGAVFADAATLYGNSLADAGTAMKLRASVGASIIGLRHSVRCASTMPFRFSSRPARSAGVQLRRFDPLLMRHPDWFRAIMARDERTL